MSHKFCFYKKPLFELTTFCFLLFTFYLPAQSTDGYRIEIGIDNYEGDTVFLGYRRGEKVYSKDTIAVNANGKFIFEGEEELMPGIYLVLMPPDNKFFDFILMRGDQHFSVSTKAPEFFKNQKIKGSAENNLVYDYQVFMSEQVELSKKIDEELAKTTDEKRRKNWKNKKRMCPKA